MINYFVNSKHTRLINGHLQSEQLYRKILDHDGTEAYCCYFDLDESLLKLEWDTGKKDKEGKTIYEYTEQNQPPSNPEFICSGKTFSKYEGICSPALGMVSFDFDSDNPQNSLDDVKKFVEWLDIDDLVVFFSGSKGFHVMVPFGYFGLAPSAYLPNQLKDLAKLLKKSYPTLDDSIYNYNRKFRVPFTKHDKSGLYKVVADPVMTMDAILQTANAEKSLKKDFLPNGEYEPSQILVQALEQSKRASYEIQKEKAGTKDAPSNFEKFDDKLCIKKMLVSTCDDIGRNNAALRIVNDFYRTGKPRKTCEDSLYKWAANNDLPASEVSEIITNIYDRGANYNFGCQDESKSTYCSGKCPIWSRLAPDKRPTVIDSPKMSSALTSEFEGVNWLMSSMFSSQWDEERGAFTLGFLIKSGKSDLFYYKDKHWQHLDDPKIHIIKQRLNKQYGNKLTERKLASVYNMLVLYTPSEPVGVDMFSPADNMTNFLDGTLKLEQVGMEYKFIFKPHCKEDYLTTMINIRYLDYERNPDEVNEKFEKWLHTALENDNDAYSLVQEMFGASLMPRFPQFFVLLGESKTGKSTCIKILLRMHKNAKYIGRLAPHKFNRFNLKSLINKSINVVLDIKTDGQIDDDIVKQIDDRIPLLVERKQMDDVEALMPSYHLFGANKMPATLEGYSGAMGRRFTIINFDKKYEGKVFDAISDYLFDHNPQGVFNFALKGLFRLVHENQGIYTKTKKSCENTEEWTSRNDTIKRFLVEAADGLDNNGKTVKVVRGDGLSMPRTTLWNYFKAWQEDAIEQRDWIARMRFYDAMKDRNFLTARRDNKEKYLGVGEVFCGENDAI